jgi:hypothetical protein
LISFFYFLIDLLISPYAMEKEADILIEKDADSFEIIDGIVNININNVFGLSIKSLADKILIY